MSQLHDYPCISFGAADKQPATISDETTMFRLLKVPKYAKRTVARMSEQKSQALMEELNRLSKDWVEQQREVEWLRRELWGAKGELKAMKEKDSYGTKRGVSPRMTRAEEEEMEALWACLGK